MSIRLGFVANSETARVFSLADSDGIDVIKPKPASKRGQLGSLMHFRGADFFFNKKSSKILHDPSLYDNQIIEVEKFVTLKQACPSENQGAQGAFKDSMIH